MDSGRTQFTEDVVDVLVVARRQDPKSKRAHKDRVGATGAVHRWQRTSSPQCKLLRRRSVITQRQVPTIRKIQKTVEKTQVRYEDDVVDVPVVT